MGNQCAKGKEGGDTDLRGKKKAKRKHQQADALQGIMGEVKGVHDLMNKTKNMKIEANLTQRASNGLREYMIFWYHENQEDNHNINIISDLIEAGFQVVPFANVKDSIAWLKKKEKLDERYRRYVVISITSGGLKEEVITHVEANNDRFKRVIIYCSDIKSHVKSRDQHPNIVYSVLSQSSKISQNINDCYADIYHSEDKALPNRPRRSTVAKNYGSFVEQMEQVQVQGPSPFIMQEVQRSSQRYNMSSIRRTSTKTGAQHEFSGKIFMLQQFEDASDFISLNVNFTSNMLELYQSGSLNASEIFTPLTQVPLSAIETVIHEVNTDHLAEKDGYVLLENAFGVKLNDAFVRIFILESYGAEVLQDEQYEQLLMDEFEKDPDAQMKLELYHMFEDILFGIKGTATELSERLQQLQSDLGLVDRLLNKLFIFSCDNTRDRKICIRTIERHIADRAYLGIGADTLPELEDAELDEFKEQFGHLMDLDETVVPVDRGDSSEVDRNKSVTIQYQNSPTTTARKEVGFKFSTIYNRDISVDGGKSLVGVLKAMKDGLDHFTDQEFPANAKSLISNWNVDQNVLNLAEIELWKQIEWVRANDIACFNKNRETGTIFQNVIKPNDIKQGQLRNSYFLSSLSAIAENPERIMNMFATKDENQVGIYEITMTKCGQKRQVILDNKIPCIIDFKGLKQPFFSKANGDELWVAILEKAWAKVHGSYERIIDGKAHETLRDLLGAPAEEFSTKSEDVLEKLIDADKRDFIVTVDIAKKDEESKQEEAKELEMFGLLQNHTYSLLSVNKIEKDGQSVYLVKLRNPWGEVEWNGNWSPTSDLWTKELKAQLQMSMLDDGTFWVSFNDFQQYFDRVCICKCIDSHRFSSLRITDFKKEFHIIKMKTSVTGQQTISVSQQCKQMLSRNSKFQNSNCRIIVLQLLNGTDLYGGVRFIKGGKGFEARDAYVECGELKQGTYYVFVEMEWNSHATPVDKFFNLTCYGAGQTVLQESDLSTKYTKLQILEEVFKQKSFSWLANIENQDKERQFKNEIPLITRFYNRSAPEGYQYVIVKNESKDATFTEEFDFYQDSILRLEMFHPKAFSKKFKLKVEPQQTKMAIIKVGNFNQDDFTGYGDINEMNCTQFLQSGYLLPPEQIAHQEVYAQSELSQLQLISYKLESAIKLGPANDEVFRFSTKNNTTMIAEGFELRMIEQQELF